MARFDPESASLAAQTALQNVDAHDRELYPYLLVRLPGSGKRAPLLVLLFYPIYGAINTVLRTAAAFVWFWFRFVSGSMRPRRGPKDRIA